MKLSGRIEDCVRDKNTLLVERAIHAAKKAGRTPWPPPWMYPQQLEWMARMRQSASYNDEYYNRFRGRFPEKHIWGHLQPGVVLEGPENAAKTDSRQRGKDTETGVFVIENAAFFGNSSHYLFPKKEMAINWWFENPLALPYEGAPQFMIDVVPKHLLLPGKQGFSKKGIIRLRSGGRIHMRSMDTGTESRRAAGGRGLGAHIVVLSEYGSDDADPEILTMYMGTGLRKNFLLLVPATPNRKNHYYRLIKEQYERSLKWEQGDENDDRWDGLQYFEQHKNWDFQNITWRHSYKIVDGERKPIITAHHKSRFLSDPSNTIELWQQEYEGKFLDVGSGSVFKRAMDAAKLAGRMLPDIEIEHHLPTYTAWDLGVENLTVIIYMQMTPEGMMNVVDCQEYQGQNIQSIIPNLISWRKRHNVVYYEEHIIPHDGAHRSLTGQIKKSKMAATIADYFHDMREMKGEWFGYPRIVPKARDKVNDAVVPSLAMFPRFRFDTVRCRDLIERLGMCLFRYDRASGQYDETKIVKSNNTRSSDHSDAFMAAATYLQDILPDSALVHEIFMDVHSKEDQESIDYDNPSMSPEEQMELHALARRQRATDKLIRGNSANLPNSGFIQRKKSLLISPGVVDDPDEDDVDDGGVY